ncbi:hypothetical protein L5515_001710 [Caenorhabditis briggsae]|nr:hypothetical protein L5515_001710 [Caenorhabditis briggsae]
MISTVISIATQKWKCSEITSCANNSILISFQIFNVYDRKNSTNIWDSELSGAKISTCHSDIWKDLYNSKHYQQRHDDLKIRNIGGSEDFYKFNRII